MTPRPPSSPSARRRERRASTISSTVSRSRDLGGRSTISAHPLNTRQAVILIPRRTAAVVLRRPVPRSRAIRRTRTDSRERSRSRIRPRGQAREAERSASPAHGDSVRRRSGLPTPSRDRRAAPCPAGSGAGRAVPAAYGRRRPVGRRRKGDNAGSDRLPCPRRWRHSRNWRHSSKFADSGGQVAGHHAQRRQHRGPEPALAAHPDGLFAKSSVLDVSDHCTPTPMVSVSTTTASRCVNTVCAAFGPNESDVLPPFASG